MELGLRDKVALVAGGGRGVGRAVAERLAAEGARVAVVARTAAEVDATAEALRAAGAVAHAATADLADPAQVESLLREVRAALGPPTILVLAAAAMFRPRKLHNVDAAEAAALLAADVGSAVHLCRLALPDMMLARFGRIVATGSVAGRMGIAGGTLYATAKAALEGLARGLAVDYSRFGITANVALLGFVDTERFRARIGDDPEARDRLARGTALRRLCAPAEVADVVTFLCSERASIVTGAVVEATGGLHLNNVV